MGFMPAHRWNIPRLSAVVPKETDEAGARAFIAKLDQQVKATKDASTLEAAQVAFGGKNVGKA